MKEKFEPRKVFVTGVAGFIGFHVAKKLLESGAHVVGFDNLNPYYDVRLKESRLSQLESLGRDFRFVRGDLSDRILIEKNFREEQFDSVVHLAAQAGVRYSLENPHTYIESNITGFLNILEVCRSFPVQHLVYASSSSVYGKNETLPWSIHHNVDHPISLYAASKKANELMAHSYSHLFHIPTTGLRFFTVYGPWGRPDMALFKFTQAILAGDELSVYNHGKMRRDFTYINDIVEGILRVLKRPAQVNLNWNGKNPDPASSSSPYRIYNIGNNQPVELMDFIRALEEVTRLKARVKFYPLQAGDIPDTYADVEDLVRDVEFRPRTTVLEGVTNFVKWYREYYKT